MRGLLAELPTPHPLGSTLPILFQSDDFVQRMCDALDEVLLPVIVTLDSLTAYLDPDTTPEDMLEWLSGWVGVALEGEQSVRRRRMLIRTLAELHRWRGTVRGVERAVAAIFDVTPQIVESGGAAWSVAPDGAMPGRPVPDLLVRLRVPDPDVVDQRQLDAVVRAIKPAHVSHRVEVVPVAT